MTPLVSFITATYNAGHYLRETIESVLAQTYPRIEYIVLDDGSTDDTPNLLRQYDGRLRWESHPNMGESRTVNKGFGLAQGDYIIVVSADDPVKPNLAEVGVQWMEQHPQALVGYPDWEMIDPQNRVLETRRVPDYDYDILLRMHFCLPGPGSLIRRRALELEQGRDPHYRYIADYEFWLRVGLHGPFVHIPQILATWRSHPNSTTISSRNQQMAAEHIRCIEALYQRTDLSPEALAAKAETLSTAYYVAAQILMPDQFEAARPYLLQSLRHMPLAPHAYPTGLMRSRRYLLCALFPFLQRILL